MFPYFGRKKRYVHLYPEPKYQLIIEPFAGSAGYSCYHKPEKALLFDTDDDICAIWNYLINVSEQEYDLLPTPEIKAEIPHDLCLGAKKLIGICTYYGRSKCGTHIHKHDYWRGLKPKIKTGLQFFRKWEIVCSDYTTATDIEATWFIDPPYKLGGKWYRKNNKNLDYEKLAEWALSRKGQVIVCEGEGGDWLDFKPIYKIKNLHNSMKQEFVFVR